MNTTVRLIIALVIAAIAWQASEYFQAVPVIVYFVAATLLTALLPANGAGAAVTGDGPSAAPRRKPAASGPREQGTVKWFNVTKGFGFITKENGDEIFVHYRSVRGEDRHALRDGQRVSFLEAQSDKGPQAEDVEPL